MLLPVKTGIADTLEYKVVVGDTMEYEITILRGEGKSIDDFSQFTKEDGTNITLSKDNKYKVEVTKVSSTGVFGKFTFNGETSKEEDMSGMILKTTGDKSHWEALEGTNNESGVEIVSTLEGDLFIQESSLTFEFFGLITNTESTTKMNIKTGWIEFMYILFEVTGAPTGTTSGEMLIESVGGGGGVSGFEFIPLLTAFVIGIIVFKRKY